MDFSQFNLVVSQHRAHPTVSPSHFPFRRAICNIYWGWSQDRWEKWLLLLFQKHCICYSIYYTGLNGEVSLEFQLFLQWGQCLKCWEGVGRTHKAEMKDEGATQLLPYVLTLLPPNAVLKVLFPISIFLIRCAKEIKHSAREHPDFLFSKYV